MRREPGICSFRSSLPTDACQEPDDTAGFCNIQHAETLVLVVLLLGLTMNLPERGMALKIHEGPDGGV